LALTQHLLGDSLKLLTLPEIYDLLAETAENATRATTAKAKDDAGDVPKVQDATEAG